MFNCARNFFLFFFIATCVSALGNVQADFTASKFYGCPPLTVTFSDQSTGGVTSWFWDFGNGNFSNSQNPSAIFNASGYYQVKLVVSNNNSSDSIVKAVQVFVLPVVSFSAQNPKVCLADSARFISNVKLGNAPIVSYAWGFGNGKASSVPNASYLYSQPGVYSITLVVQDSNGCNANKTIPQYITVVPMPQAAFTASPASSCNATQTVNFTNNSTGADLTYQWNLNTGVNSTQQNPTYTYTQESYKVTLVVTDSNGCESAATHTVSAQELAASFMVANPKPCTGQTVSFQNTSNFTGTSWFWDFGNGQTSTSNNPSTVYPDTGTYTVKFVIYDGSCADSVTMPNYIHVIQGFSSNLALFSADSTLSCGSPITVNFHNNTPGTNSTDTFFWTFGNGDTSSLQNPSETFTGGGSFNVSLTITDTNGCVITAGAPGFVIESPPMPAFIVTGNSCPESPVNFNNKSINAVSYLWNFGDGDTSTLKSPIHSYAAAGKYTVTLTAFGYGTCDSTITVVDAVTVGSLPASFIIQDTFSPCPPFVAIFKNTTPTGAKAFLWNFGDGYSDTVTNPTHIYYHPGVFTVSLLVYQNYICRDTAFRPNLITVQGPTGNFNITPVSGCLPLEVTVSSSMSDKVKTFECDMGDGSVIDDTANFSHTYTQPRSYYPQFILTDYAGCTVYYPLDTIVTHSAPAFQLRDTSVCAGMSAPVKIIADSNSYSYTWFPASYVSCDTCNSVVVSAPDSMLYKVVATNQWGCQTTDSMHVNVVPLPVLNDSATINLCKKDDITISAGNPGYRYSWSPGLYLSDSTASSPLCTPLASIVYTVNAFNALGCPSQTMFSVNVKDKLEVTIPPDTSACMFGTIQLKANVVYGSALGVQYYWSPVEYVNNPNIANPEVLMGDKSEKLTLVANSGHCIADTLTTDINVIPLPDIEVSPNVTTTPGTVVPIYADSHQDLTYQWTAKDSLSCAGCRRTDITANSSQVVYVQGTSSQGCTISDSLTITVQGCDGKSVFLPNTFTPNGDGIDDKFYIRTQALTSLKFFRIFDSWGQQVFETNNLSEGWDGMVNGQHAPVAVYVYELEGVCQNGYSVFKSGNVTALR